MRCTGCGNSSRAPIGKSWEKWILCGDCAYKEHPEHYPRKVTSQGGRWRGDELRVEGPPRLVVISK